MSGLSHTFRVRRLYKMILRLHRGMPNELRELGDAYAREEFKRHKHCSPNEAKIFLNGWTDYAIDLAKQLRPHQKLKHFIVGKDIQPEMLDVMRDDQILQLYELRKAAANEPSDLFETEPLKPK